MMKKAIRKQMLLSAVLTAITVFSLAATALAQSIYTGTVSADKVFFRMKPNTDAGYHAMLKKGDKVGVLGMQGTFYKVKFNGTDGYVMKKFVTLSSADLKKLTGDQQAASKSKYAKTATIKELGTAPGNVKFGDSGQKVEKLQRALQLKKCYDGAVDGKFGNQTREALETYQKKHKLPVTGKADYDTLRSIFGSAVETDAKNDPKMKGITSISQIEVPNTTHKNNSGKHVTALQQALKLKGCYTAAISGKYDDLTVEAVKKYQQKAGLTADGVAGNSTIKKLFGKNAANYVTPTEKLDWFKGGSTVIPKGATFTVKDVLSGVTFSCKRWSGYNHLDAEPVDAQATARFKDAVGGSWSWARRPALVKYSGHVYAASIISMPHEDDTIPGNNYDGHFCIHFFNSRTHETNHLDSEHQNCVNRAAQTTW